MHGFLNLAWPGASALRGKYVAVADWRPSNTGKPLEQRGLNLSISTKGISDFGDGPKGYSPINFVMAACGLGDDRGRAFMMLSDWLGRVPVFSLIIIHKMIMQNKMDFGEWLRARS